MSLLGIHIGKSACTALAISRDGHVTGQVRQDLPAGRGRCRLEAGVFWNCLRDVLSAIARQTARDPIQALALTSPGDAWAALSPNGFPLDRCLIPTEIDTRAGEEMLASIGRERLYDITGHIPRRTSPLFHLAHLRHQAPDILMRAWRFLPLASLAAHLLGGSSACDFSLAARSLLLDIRRRGWSREILGMLGLSLIKLPPLLEAGHPIGTVAPHIAQDVGLPPDVQIVLGGYDLCCEALGAGITEQGMATYALGHSMRIMPCFYAVPLVRLMMQNELESELYVLPDLSLTGISNEMGGRLLRWFSTTLTPLERREAQRRGLNPYTMLLEEMPEEPTDLLTILPPVAPERRAQSIALVGLRPHHSRGQVVRALLEGMSLAMAEAQEILSQVGIPIQRYRAIGGGSRSDRWLQLTADVLGRPIERTALTQTAALGAAILAGLGNKTWASVDQAVQTVVHVSARFLPNAKRHRAYQRKLTRYRELAQALSLMST